VVFSAGVHDGALRRAILRYKYRREQWWAGVFARLLSEFLAAHATWFEEFELLVPTPSYLGPGARRDWDPVGEIVARLRPLVTPAWPIEARAIAKRAETPPMQGRSWSERQAIARGPLRDSLVVPSRAVVDGARLLVVDDVLTEGSTLREMARALRAAGAAEVAGLVLARPPWPAHAPRPGAGGRAVRSAGG
jgi:predicted amidophosphoribosyltransferase